MKLKTVLKNGSLDRTGSVGIYFGNCEHDAAAAHALLQSLNEHVGDHTNLSLCIIRRAGDILAEWGYGDE